MPYDQQQYADPYDQAGTPSQTLKDPDLRTYGVGLQTGNPLNDIITQVLTNGQVMPTPRGTQDVFSAFTERERNQQFIRIQQQQFANNQLFSQFGLNPNSSTLQVGGLLFGQPNSAAMQTLAPLIGGNPVAAQQQLYANMTGTTNGAFGLSGNIGFNETTSMMNTLNRNFYNTTKFDRDKAQSDIYNSFKNQFQGAQGDSDLQQRYGITSGQINPDFFKQQGANFDQNNSLIGQTIRDLDSDVKTPGMSNDQMKELVVKKVENFSKQLKGVDQKIIDKYINVQQLKDLSGKSGTTLDDLAPYDNLLGLQNELSQDPAVRAHMDLKGLAQIPDTVLGSINNRNARGFTTNDFVSGITAAANVRLISSHGGDRDAALQDFMLNGVGTMSAARGIFGNKDQGELVKELSALIGKGTTDLSDTNQSHDLEKLLRSTKSAARMAGASIEAIMGINKEAQNLAAQHPELQYLSGTTLLRGTRDALNEASLVNQSQDSASVRRQGGVEGVMGSQIGENIKLQTSSISKNIAGLMELYNGNDGKGINEKARKIITDYANSGSASPATYGDLLNQLSQTTGSSAMQIGLQASSPLMQQLGMSREGVADLGLKAAKTEVNSEFESRIGAEGVAELQKAYAENPKDMQSALAQVASKYGIADTFVTEYGTTLQDHYLRKFDPTYAKNAAYQDDLQAAMTKQATEMSQNLDNLFGGKAQNIFQAFMSGKDGHGQIQAIMNAFVQTDSLGNISSNSYNKELQNTTSNLQAFKDDIAKNLGAAGGDRAVATKMAATSLLNKTTGKNFSLADTDRADKYLAGLGNMSFKDFKDDLSHQDKTMQDYINSLGISSEKDYELVRDNGISAIDRLQALQQYKKYENLQAAPKLDAYEKSATDAINSDNSEYGKTLKKLYSTNGKFDFKKYTAAEKNDSLKKDLLASGPISNVQSFLDADKTSTTHTNAMLYNQLTDTVDDAVKTKEEDATSGDPSDLLKQIINAITGTNGLAASISSIANSITSLTKS